MDNKPREYSENEIRENFLRNVWSIVDYWKNEELENDTMENRIEGVVFSILAMLDGANINLPSFIVAPSPHKDDKEYSIKNNHNYYPYNDSDNIKGNIAGCLHELFDRYKK
jgi:hypothetical protein